MPTRPQSLRSVRLAAMLLCSIAATVCLVPSSWADDRDVIRVPRDSYCVTVESLVDNVADLDVRRITVYTRSRDDVTLTATPGEFKPRSLERAPGRPPLFFWETVMITRLETIVELNPETGHRELKDVVSRFLKFSRTRGSSSGIHFPAEDIKDLDELLDIRFEAGCFPLGTQKLLGTFRGRGIRVLVE